MSVPGHAYNRLAMSMKKMAPGTMGGQSRVANLPGPTASVRVSAPPAPEPLTCPTFLGRTQTTMGFGGPFLLPDQSEIIQWNDSVVRRYAYPVNGSPEIESFSPSGSTSGMALTPDSALWRVNSTGDIIRRNGYTSAASDTTIDTLAESRAQLVYSSHDGNLYAVTFVASSTINIYRITLGGTVTLMQATGITVGTTAGSQAVTPIAVAAGSSVWFTNPTVVGYSITGFNLWRYDIDADTFASVGTPTPTDGAMAVDHQGYAIYSGSNDPTMLYRINEDEESEYLDCPELYAPGGESGLQGGNTIPGDPSVAVMSHYYEYTG